MTDILTALHVLCLFLSLYVCRPMWVCIVHMHVIVYRFIVSGAEAGWYAPHLVDGFVLHRRVLGLSLLAFLHLVGGLKMLKNESADDSVEADGQHQRDLS